jgi:UMF1 family MFS transporter
MAAVPATVNDKREIFGWTMYDWASSAFSTTVLTVFLNRYLTAVAETASQATGGFLYLGNVPIRYDSFFTFCVSASVLLQVTFLPILGALADYSHLRKQLLMLFSLIGSVATLLMFFIGPEGFWLGGLLLIIANVAVGASYVFYNAYLPSIASESERDHVSARGFAMGYAGGGLLLLLNLVLYLFSDGLGLSDALVARISLASAGAWWLGFSLITFRTLRARHAVRPLPPGQTYLTIGFQQLANLMNVPAWLVAGLMALPLLVPILLFTAGLMFVGPAGLQVPLSLLPALGPIAVLVIFMIRKSRQLPEAVKYLLAYLLFNDGIQTVIVITTVFATLELELPATTLILVVLMIQVVGFGGAFLFSALARRIGTRNAILFSLVVWSAVVIYAYFGMKSRAIVLGMEQRHLEFYLLAFVVALILGGSQALSRSLFAQMIPKDQEAEFFSFYEISERGTSWMGTFIFGAVNQVYGSLRLGILSLIFFFVAGLVLLPLVNVAKAMREGKQASPPAEPLPAGAPAGN